MEGQNRMEGHNRKKFTSIDEKDTFVKLKLKNCQESFLISVDALQHAKMIHSVMNCEGANDIELDFGSRESFSKMITFLEYYKDHVGIEKKIPKIIPISPTTDTLKKILNSWCLKFVDMEPNDVRMLANMAEYYGVESLLTILLAKICCAKIPFNSH